MGWFVRTTLLAAALLGLPAQGAAADAGALQDMLRQTPEEPTLYGDWRMFEYVDLAALGAAAGVEPATRLADLESLAPDQRSAVEALLARLVAIRRLAFGLQEDAGRWQATLGIDFLQVGWISESALAKLPVKLLGGETLPRGDDLAGLARAGFVPVEREGVTLWSAAGSGAEDLPMWRDLGSAPCLFRAARALLGAATCEILEVALAVERGGSPSLADLPRYRLLAEAIADPALSAGPVLQMVVVDEVFGERRFSRQSDGAGLPPFGLFAFAERQDATGHQLVLALTYDERAAAEEAAAGLAATLTTHRRLDLLRHFPGLDIRASVVESADGAAAVVLLAMPQGAPQGGGAVRHGSFLFEHFYVAILHRFTFDFLAVRD